MSSYNRTNPFLYTFDAVSQKLMEETQNLIKYLIIHGVLEFFVIVLSITRWITYQRSQFIPIILTLGLLGYGIFELRNTIQITKSIQVNVLKYGQSTMTYTYVNNEELFTQVNDINIHLGKIEALKESIIAFDLINLMIIVIQLLAVMIYIFR